MGFGHCMEAAEVQSSGREAAACIRSTCRSLLSTCNQARLGTSGLWKEHLMLLPGLVAQGGILFQVVLRGNG